MKPINNIRKPIITLGLLTALVGLFATGCSSSQADSSERRAAVVEPADRANSDSEKATEVVSDDRSKAEPAKETRTMTAAEAGEDEFYIENNSRQAEARGYASTTPTQAELTTHDGAVLDEVIPGMIVGMPYEVARILITNEGWRPMEGLTPASRNGMDYAEVEDCSGSGLGPCNMVFVDSEMNTFGVGVITSGAEPTVRHWNLNLGGTRGSTASGSVKSSDANMDNRPVLQDSANLQFLEANVAYRDEYFTEDIYEKLAEEHTACSFEPNCNVAYLFKDVIFRISGMNNGSSAISVTPHELVPRSLAMTYAQILDRHSEIDFERPPEVGDNREGPSNGEAYVGRASYGQKTFHSSGYTNVIQMELRNNSETVQAIKLVTYET